MMIFEKLLFESLRVSGYTKMLLAATLYLAEHKKRNIGIWREDDDAAKEFVNLELDPAMRDCKPIIDIFPDIHKKSEKNKSDEKHLLGCSIHIRGGQAAGGYRALSKDVVIGDEIDGFVQNVQGKGSKEGNPLLLMLKRLVGSSFPKSIFGTTPTVAGSSHIQRREKAAECRLYCEVPCPHCDEFQVLKFGDPKVPFGFRWDKDDPDSVRYCCEHCAAEFEYHDFLDVTERCVWRDNEKDIETTDGLTFFSIETGREKEYLDPSVLLFGQRIHQPRPGQRSSASGWTLKTKKHHCRFLEIRPLANIGITMLNRKSMAIICLDVANIIRARTTVKCLLPDGALYITAGVDTQDNRFAYEIVAWGKNRENWSLEYKEIMGPPR